MLAGFYTDPFMVRDTEAFEKWIDQFSHDCHAEQHGPFSYSLRGSGYVEWAPIPECRELRDEEGEHYDYEEVDFLSELREHLATAEICTLYEQRVYDEPTDELGIQDVFDRVVSVIGGFPEYDDRDCIVETHTWNHADTVEHHYRALQDGQSPSARSALQGRLPFDDDDDEYDIVEDQPEPLSAFERETIGERRSAFDNGGRSAFMERDNSAFSGNGYSAFQDMPEPLAISNDPEEDLLAIAYYDDDEDDDEEEVLLLAHH